MIAAASAESGGGPSPQVLPGPERRSSCRIRQFLGSLVEWDGEYTSFSKERDYIRVVVREQVGDWRATVSLELIPGMLDVVELLSPEQRLHFRGILTEALAGMYTLNYVDIAS